MMQIKNVQHGTAKFLTADSSMVQLFVEFVELPLEGFLPFGACPYDVEPHGRELYARAMSGEFGPIAPFVPK